ncbi:VOC family protein [Hoeflea prorocentri]|uniref:VOC family protein n=1 Tax=Hoeflea prorocentri TaxID=1922333 RepID=A0A9X3UIT2_9HYPH|nr:VOC family protein [Hoeflea prorocentri]MCY6381200.1 VOC family protein [Hoeflea prorocentri]MDA5399000.1 VOC family protein [Hoeflea prorocentri]
MHIARLDHVNIITVNLTEMVAWYEDILGLVAGERPPFKFPGAWIYIGNDPVIHLVTTEGDRQSIEPNIEHFALSASGLAAFIKRLEDKGVGYRMNLVPDFPIVQVNIHDYDGNHIHVDFPLDELSDELKAKL